jgi:hypothetical protein
MIINPFSTRGDPQLAEAGDTLAHGSSLGGQRRANWGG